MHFLLIPLLDILCSLRSIDRLLWYYDPTFGFSDLFLVLLLYIMSSSSSEESGILNLMETFDAICSLEFYSIT